jgi:hypothetical protein
MRGLFTAAILSALGLASCDSQPSLQSDAVSMHGHTIFIRGRITHHVEREFETAISSRVIIDVVLDSEGGEVGPAIHVAKIIRQKHLNVMIDGVCLSACATYIFAVAKTPNVKAGSLVFFHHTPNSLLKMLGTSRDLASGLYARDAKEGEDLLRSSGISLSLLYDPQLQVRTTCYQLAGSGMHREVQYFSRFQGWLPSRQYLANAGMRVQGFWPKSAGEVIAALRKQFAASQDVVLAFGGASVPMPQAQVDELYRTIPACGRHGNQGERINARTHR